MAFGNIDTFFTPRQQNSGAVLWGAGVYTLRDVRETNANDPSTETQHGNGGNTNRTIKPYQSSNDNVDESGYGFAVSPEDMASVVGAKRFIRAGDHVVTNRVQGGAVAKTGCRLSVSVYRVSAGPARTRTLIASGQSAAFTTNALVTTVTTRISAPEIIFGSDETIQYSWQMLAPGTAVVGANYIHHHGTQNNVPIRIDHPGLGVLADTHGSAQGEADGSGQISRVLAARGGANGQGAADGRLSSIWSTTGASNGSSDVAGLVSTIAGTVAQAEGAATAQAQMSRVLGTVGMVNIGDVNDAPAPVVRRSLLLLVDE